MRNSVAVVLVVWCGLLIPARPSSGDDKEKKDPVGPIKAEEVKLDRPVDFERDIYPILEAKCIACHNLAINESKFILEDVESILKGGKRGPSVVAKEPDKSLLYQVAARMKAPAMPPLPNTVEAAALTPKELGLIRQWILEGAGSGGGAKGVQVTWRPIPPSINAIYSVALSPWGRLAAAGRANQIQVYDVAAGEEVARLVDPSLAGIEYEGKPMYPDGAAHRDFVHSLAFNHDGTLLASGGYRVVKLWQRPTNVQRFQIPAGQPVTAVAVSPDGKWIAVGAADNTIKLANATDGKPARTLSGHTAAITGLRFSADGSKLVSSSADKSLRVWNVADGAVAGRIDTPAAVNDVTLNKEGTQIIAAGEDNFIRTFATPPAPAPVLANAETPVAAIAVSPDKKWLALAGSDGKITLVELASGKPAKTLTGHSGAVSDVAFSSNSTRLASGGADKTVRVWDVAEGKQLASIEAPAAVTAVSIHPGGEQVVSGAADNGLKLWNVADGKELKNFAGHSKPVTAAIFAPDGNSVYSASEDGTVRRFNVGDGQQQFAANHGAPVHDLALSPNGQLLASAGENKQVRVWNAANGGNAPKPTLEGFEAPVKSVTFTGDNARIVGGAANNQALVFHVAEGVLEQVFAEHTGPVEALAVTGEKGEVVLSASADKTVRSWSPAAAGRIAGHGGPVTSVELLPNGTQIASGSKDGTLRTWNLANGQQVRAMGHGGPVTAVAVRPDGQALASAGENGVAKLWRADNGQQIAELKGDLKSRREIARLMETQAVAKQVVGQANNRIQTAEKNVKDREESLKKATEAKTAADKALADAQGKAKSASDALAAAQAELGKKPDDKGLQEKVKKAQETSTKEAAAHKKAMDEQESAARNVDLGQKGVERAKQELESSKKEHADAEAHSKKVDSDLAERQKQDQGPAKPVRAVAFSPDGKKLATAGDDNAVRVWNAADGSPLGTFEGHQGPVAAVAFTTGSDVVSGSADKTAVLWETRPAWKLVGQLGPKKDAPLDLSSSPFVGRVLALDFSRDGKLLATGGGEPSRSGELMVWDVEKQSLVREIEDAHSDTVGGVEFSRDGKRLLSGAADKFAKIFEVETGKHVRSFEGHTHHVLDVSWQADGSSIATAGADNAVKVWNVETGEQRRTIGGFNKEVTSIQYIGVGDVTVSSSGDKTVRFHRTGNGQNYRNFGGAGDFMYATAAARSESAVVQNVNSDATIVAAGGEDGVLRVWNGTNGQSIATFEPPKPPGDAAQASAAGK